MIYYLLLNPVFIIIHSTFFLPVYRDIYYLLLYPIFITIQYGTME